MTAAHWTCPDCHRQFARQRQWHSCQPQSLDVHFVNKDPALRPLFDLLIARLKKTGPLRVDAVKTSINLISRHHFGGVMVRRDHLRVGFLAQKPINHVNSTYRREGNTIVMDFASRPDGPRAHRVTLDC